MQANMLAIKSFIGSVQLSLICWQVPLKRKLKIQPTTDGLLKGWKIHGSVDSKVQCLQQRLKAPKKKSLSYLFR